MIGLVTLVVDDYDTAITYYTSILGFDLIEDTELGAGKRWVVVGPPGGAALLLARAATYEQRDRIGDQTGGRVAFFLYTDNVTREYTRMRASGVDFEQAPRTETYGTVAVFRDRYGNRWDLLTTPERGTPTPSA